MKEKRAYKKNEIPYVTQIFTPDWIVKYMVENSLGRLYIEKTGDESLESEFKYFIKDNIEIDNKGIMPENITFIDPCMGSGHILIYAFEVFMKLYLNAGYNKKDIPELILKNNLYGLDIDDRAGQFAILSIVLKAREYDKDIFNKIEFNKLNILSIQGTDNYNDLMQCARSIREADIRETAEYLIETFKNAKEIGSLLIVEDRDYDKLGKYLDTATNTVMNMLLRDSLKDVIRVAKILSKKYDVVVMNPPYLSLSKMEEHIKPYIEHYYKDSKADLCTAFMETRLVEKERYLAMINMQSWMFLLTYEELRKKIVKCKYITNLMHLGAHAFEEMSGEVLQTVSVVFKEGLSQNKNGNYIRLVDIDDAEKKETEFFNYKNLFNINQQKFENIPDAIYGYWLSDGMIDVFKNSNKLSDIAEPKQGMVTRDNNRFIRAWWEVNFDNIEYNVKNHEESYKSSKKWYPITDGGTYRKWYGNIQSVVNFLHDGKEIIDFSGSHIKNREYYFRENITWSAIFGDSISMRYTNKGFCPEHAGNCLYCDHDKLILLLAICNSNIIVKIMKALSPTLNFNVGQIANIPITKKKIENSEIENNVNKCIKDSKGDWDSFETSWDFKKHPLV